MIKKILKKTKERHGSVGVVRVFKEACDALAEEVNSQLFDGCRNWYWVADEHGGVCDFEDVDFLGVEDMVRVIENELTYRQYAEWREANLEHEQYINLKSWLRGARHEMLKCE